MEIIYMQMLHCFILFLPSLKLQNHGTEKVKE